MGWWDDLWKGFSDVGDNLNNFWGNAQKNVNNMGGFTNPAGTPVVPTNNNLFMGGGGGTFGSRPKATLKEDRDSGRVAGSSPWKPGDGGVKAAPPAETPGLNPDTSVGNSAIMQGYLREIQDRLARSRAVAPTVALNTQPIDSAKETSIRALQEALQSVVSNVEQARANTKSAYGQAKTDTQGAYDHIVANSRKEGKKAAEDSGDYVQKALADASSVAMSGVNQDMTNSDKLLAEAASSLGGNKAVVDAVDKRVDPNNSTETIRNNISQNYQDTANNAATQTGRDINAASRYADTIASDGAGAIASLVAELANRNNMYDRDIADAQTANASNVANIQSTYADKLMQAQLAQQQEQSSLNNAAWQTNTNNEANALQGMIDLIGADNNSRLEQEMAALEASNSANNSGSRSQDKQLEILLEGLVKRTDKNTLSQEDMLELLRQIQAG